MKNNKLLDLTYGLHALLAGVLVKSTAMEAAGAYVIDFAGARSKGVTGVAIIAAVAVIAYSAAVNYKRREILPLLILLIVSMLLHVFIISAIYLYISLIFCYHWFKSWREPPILRL